MKNQMPYFTIKTKLEYVDGRIIEGYTAYDLENDETSFTAMFNSESTCIYMSLKTCREMAGKIRETLKSVKKINGICRISVKPEHIKKTDKPFNLNKNCINGVVHYYLTFCV